MSTIVVCIAIFFAIFLTLLMLTYFALRATVSDDPEDAAVTAVGFSPTSLVACAVVAGVITLAHSSLVAKTQHSASDFKYPHVTGATYKKRFESQQSRERESKLCFKCRPLAQPGIDLE